MPMFQRQVRHSTLMITYRGNYGVTGELEDRIAQAALGCKASPQGRYSNPDHAPGNSLGGESG